MSLERTKVMRPTGLTLIASMVPDSFSLTRLRAGRKPQMMMRSTTISAGTLSDFKVVKSVNPLLDSEALRAAKAMTVKWKPGRKDGRPISCTFALPIDFKLK